MKRVGILVTATLLGLAFPIPSAWAPCHTVGFQGDPYTVGEGAGKVTITVSNGGGQQSSDMMVDYRTVNGTAKSPMDYTQKSGTLTFGAMAPGVLTFDVPIRNDSIDEPAERFTIELSKVRPPQSCAPPPRITNGTATVTIGDNDKPEPKPSPTPTQTRTRASPSPSPTPSGSASPSPSPTVSASPSPTLTAIAAPDTTSDGGLSGGALAGIVAGVIVAGGGAALIVRRRFLA